ncbi:MAG: RHS repeat-associated core domain-containing protein [Fermentimonas sp.]
MKFIKSSTKNITFIVSIGIVVFFNINEFAYSQNNNDSINPAEFTSKAIQEKAYFVNPRFIADSLMKRPDVKNEIEVTEEGDTTIHFVYPAFDFGEIYTANSVINVNAKKNIEEQNDGSQITANAMVQTIDQAKSVGQIPFDEGVTSTGGKTITIPILTAMVSSSSPQIALSYNSQVGNSAAGYGWSISGIPSINITNKTIYYDGVNAPSDISTPAGCAFALDGIRLVKNNNSAVPDYHYETSQGYVLVKKIMSGANVVRFEVLFPDGSKAAFGLPSNTTTRISYPITSIVDIKGYRIDFEYITSGNMYFISKIKYGSKTTTHPAEIKFEYEERTDFATAYIFNTAISQNKILKKIISNNNGQEIRTYKLTHSLDNDVNRLIKLDCSSGTSSLNPLVFGYDYYPSYMPNRQLNERSFGFLSQYFNNDPDNKMQFLRGKFIKNSFADGMITFPGKFSTYGLLEAHKNQLTNNYTYSYNFGSTYPADQTILIVPKLDYFSKPISITAESGFQTINAADVNGDGIDEIVKVNFNGTTGTKAIIKITIYTLTSENSYSKRTFNVNVEGVVNSGSHYSSPISRSYYFGDFKGDGKVQLLTVSHNKTFDNKDRPSYFALIDLNGGKLLSENTIFSHSSNEDKYVHTFDANGDAKTELCFASPSSYKVYGLSGNSFTLQYSSSVVPRSVFNKEVKFGDLNADGKLDILVPPDDSYPDTKYAQIPVWSTHYCPLCGKEEPIIDEWGRNCRNCNQNVKEYFEQNLYTARCRECHNQLQWCSNIPGNNHQGEGLCCQYHGSTVYTQIDMGYVDNGNAWTCYINTGKGFKSTYQNIVDMKKGDKITIIDINHDGLSDLIQLRGSQARLYLNINGTIQASSDVNSINVSGKSDFMPANVVNYYNSSYLVCIKDAEIFTYEFLKDKSKDNLLTSITDSHGLLHMNTYSDMLDNMNYVPTNTYYSYPYTPFTFPLNLLGSSVTQCDYANYISNKYYTYYGAVIHQQGLGFVGFDQIKTKDMLTGIESTETKDPKMFGVTTKVSSPIKDILYYYDRNEENNKQANPRVTSISEYDKLRNVNISSNYQYDAYNNPTKITQQFGSDVTTVTTQTYYASVTSARFISGQPLVKTVTNTRGGSSWTDKEEITYDATTRLPISKRTYTGTNGTNKTGEIEWAYDANGNIASEKSAPYNVTEFLGTTYTYDPSGRYVGTAKNSLNQTTTYSNYDKYGNARTITDYKGRQTTRVFDDWGRQISARSPDGVVETTNTAWGGQGVYTVTKTITGRPESIVHYDAAGREVRKGNQRFNGQCQYVDNIYDKEGRLKKVSLPFKGSSPTHWSIYDYDKYNRITQITEASGKITSWSYNGLSITETKNEISTTKTTDASGALVRVNDPGGTITYEIRADGQPTSITAPGGAVTSFTYDAFGRQTSITDPSAGTQTFSESYTASGVLTRTTKDANGKTITSVSDKYGRVTNINRPEFNTSYTYNSDGLLTNETSTNGTSTSFTYDSFDRPATIGENAPDSKWLKKTFSYGSGNIVAIKYESQNGVIGTENFTYAYGNNTEIKFGTTTIWKLTEENDLGQPTKATTGTLARTYEFTEFGMPTGRTAGNIQNFSYDFDVNKGNLKSRKDNIHNKTETFGYDNLNRLDKIGTQQIGYDLNGNITKMPGVGTMEYGNTNKPYQVTMITPTGKAVPIREQNITYTSFQRPGSITENGFNATFTYNASGDRAKMQVKQNGKTILSRYYIGKQYETDVENSIERLYLGGDANSAPAVYVKENNVWKIYYICRDYLGSITQVANTDGSLNAEYSYDAWGMLRNPATHETYAPGNEPTLILGRGYTGHEHLSCFGLINMNARLYDATLGRFLSPDPYVQTPDFTQNFNRYSYCLNNPLVYVDEDGEFFFSLLLPGIGTLIDAACWGAVIGGAGYTASVAFSPGGFNNWNWGQFGKAVGIGAISGVATAGIGQIFGPVGSMGIGGEVARAYTHGFANGMISQFSGGNFMQGVASNGLGSLAGSAFMMYGGSFAASEFGTYVFSGLSGGIGAELFGGNFWQGATVGVMNSGLNHLQQSITYAGERYFANKKAAYKYMWDNTIKKDRELSGWELENGGIIVLPFDENTDNVSHNGSLQKSLKTGKYYKSFNCKRYEISTHVHTHPGSGPSDNPIQFSKSDLKMIQKLNTSIHIIQNKRIYSFDGTYNYRTKMWNYKEIKFTW